MNHRTNPDHPVRRGHDPGDHLRRVAAAQMEMMAEDVRRLTLALHELSRHERARRPPARLWRVIATEPPSGAAGDGNPDGAAA
ncbi:hypothetical protein [Kitasatospora sp. NPDC059571]|uniref:hypothetical protein n=1 Tax=Kitasatospora sp. NPDC059571 TaxID=3346871 RepID=UPI00369EF865